MSKIGIITYHAAYNYGSVLQAKATQEVVNQLGHEATIINYRPIVQKKYYEKLYRTDFNIKTYIKDLALLPVQKQRRIRNKRFEYFIDTEFTLTANEYSNPVSLKELDGCFDSVISGSDQLLNKHSNELESEPWAAMDPYLLTFVTKGKRLSYGSSPASMTGAELNKIADKLRRFDRMSAREKDAANTLSEIVGYTVPNVLDPTLLLDQKQWYEYSKRAKKTLPKSYVLYYSLDGTNKMLGRVSQLKELSRKVHAPVVAITPFAMLPYSKQIISGHDIGPFEFIKAIDNAKLVVTDSYHGTLFSINMDTPFWSISNGKSSSTRKDQVLERLHLTDRVVPSLESVINKNMMIPEKPKNRKVMDSLELAREESILYLKDALK